MFSVGISMQINSTATRELITLLLLSLKCC